MKQKGKVATLDFTFNKDPFAFEKSMLKNKKTKPQLGEHVYKTYILKNSNEEYKELLQPNKNKPTNKNK